MRGTRAEPQVKDVHKAFAWFAIDDPFPFVIMVLRFMGIAVPQWILSVLLRKVKSRSL
jgi:hypothetical protein